MKKRLIVMFAVLCLLGGCGKNEGEQAQSGALDSYGANITIKDIKEKYDYSDDTIMPLYNVAPGEAFDFTFPYDITEEDDVVTVHTDEACGEESRVTTYHNAEKLENGTKVTISPVAGVLTTETEDEEYLKSNQGVWGNAPMYYIAIWYDMEADSVKKLDVPKIVPFTVKQEVKAPEVKGVVDTDGRFKLMWNPVEGAEEYRIYKLVGGGEHTGEQNEALNGAKTGYQNCSLLFEKAVSDTEFDDFAGNGSGLSIHEDKLSGEQYVIGQNYSVNGEFYVSAVVGGKESGFCGAVQTAERKLPHKLTEENDIMFKEYKDTTALPLVLDVVNIDGSVSKRKVLYTYQPHPTYLGTEVPGYKYQIEGTALTGRVTMEDLNGQYPDTVGDVTPSGNVEPENNVEKKPTSDLPTILNPETGGSEEGALVEQQKENTKSHVERGNEQSVDNPEGNVELFADSAEEEWIALNLVNGESEISMEAFPVLQNAENLEDTFYKVYYQNPYVLGLSRFSYDYATMTLHVIYSYDKDEIRKKQKEMMAESEKIVGEVVKEEMSAEEKEKAIYQYLTDNAQYDTEALEDAKKNNFQKTEDNHFEDSFNGYGILVNKKGVCQSYAYACKLLCERSGVPCRVVTGNLDGNLPHAWNAVKLGNEWFQVDATNNEKTTGIPYFLYNADSTIAEQIGFDTDKSFELDSGLEQYRTENDTYEYYKANGLVADSMEQYEEILDRVLTGSDGAVSIRYTEQNVEQEKLVAAVQRVYNKHGMEDKLATLKCGIQSRYIILQ